MQDQNQKTQSNPISAGVPVAPTASMPTSGMAPKLDDVVNQPTAKPVETAKPATPTVSPKPTNDSTKPAKDSTSKAAPGIIPRSDFEQRIIDKIQKSENILVALSRDPSVDEMAAAIGLTLFLDTLQKHTTAIFSGQVPDALQFLQPDETFETNTDSLQDFIIALNKDKADHLRYKLDGDYVKVYITPYKTVISENDLEFMKGDYNVDLVLALGVPTAGDLDDALSEHGRIMHDSIIVDITCDAPGRFGEIEWSDMNASSVSEMVAKMLLDLKGKDGKLDQDVATALLTGIVAATGRFSNDRTGPQTFELASKLTAMGADQQLIAAHVMDNDTPAPAPRFDMPSEPASFAPVMTAPLPDTPVVVGPDVPVIEQLSDVNVMPSTPAVSEEGMAAAEVAKTAVDAAAANVAAVLDGTNQAETSTSEPAATTPVAPMVPESTPTPEASGAKDYAAMIDAALAEPNMAPNNTPVMNQTATESTVVAPNAAPVPNNAEQVVLPPPPTPMTAEAMMPPILPPVQVNPGTHEMAAAPETNESASAEPATPPEPGAFRIPGM